MWRLFADVILGSYILMEHVFPSLMYELEDNSEYYIRSWSWTEYLSLNVASWFCLLCVGWYVAFLHCFCCWFYMICDISISLCVCALDMPIILQHRLVAWKVGLDTQGLNGLDHR